MIGISRNSGTCSLVLVVTGGEPTLDLVMMGTNCRGPMRFYVTRRKSKMSLDFLNPDIHPQGIGGAMKELVRQMALYCVFVSG